MPVTVCWEVRNRVQLRLNNHRRDVIRKDSTLSVKPLSVITFVDITFLSVIIFITWRKVRDILPTKNYCRRKILPFLEFCEWHIKLNSTILPQHPPTWSLDRKDRLNNINIIKLSCLLKKFPQFLPIPKFLIVTIPMNFFNYSLVVLIVLTRILTFHIPY